MNEWEELNSVKIRFTLTLDLNTQTKNIHFTH